MAGAAPNDRLKNLYEDLKREYDLTLDRRKTLTGQAANLMSFAGVINTVLVALLISLATSKDVRALLAASPYYSLLKVLAVVGFFLYILAGYFSLRAFTEGKWMRVPEMPDPDPLDSIETFYADPDLYEPKFFAFQLVEATAYHQHANDLKFKNLRIALILLLLGIVVTGIAGLVLFTLAS